MIEFLGFTPDIDPSIPGAMPDVQGFIPTSRGMKTAPSGVTASATLATECRGLAVLQKTSGERRTIAGTQTLLYELQTAGSWATVGGTYAGGAENRWSFSQIGDVALAANGTDAIQSATATTFTAIAGAPKAKFLVGIQNFTVALNTDDATASATFGASPDRWWCHAFQDPTSWTPSITTQAASGRLIGNGGPITAGHAFGDGLVVFKQREMFFGRHVGPPSIFDFQRIPGDQGCVGQDAVADIGGALFFVGDDSLWVYDGSRPITIGSDVVRRWLFDAMAPSSKRNCIVRYDASNNHVWVFYPSNTTTTGRPNAALVYHPPSKKWGTAKLLLLNGVTDVQAASVLITGGVTWDTIGSIASSWDAMPALSWDSESFQAQGRVLSFVSGARQVMTLNGAPGSTNFKTHFFGNEALTSFLRRVAVRFYTQPPTSNLAMNVISKSSVAETGFSNFASSTSLVGSHFDVRCSGKIHQCQFIFNGATEVIGFEPQMQAAGQR